MYKDLDDTIIKYLTGNMSAEEAVRFEKNLEQSGELSDLFKSYKNTWELTNQLEYNQDALDASWLQFEQKVKASKNTIGFDWLKVAASITLLAVFSYSMWFFGSTDISFTANSNIEQLCLADKSKIILDENSTVTYDKSFGKKSRDVSLSGQADFAITKGKMPFVVHTPCGNIEVLGTHFNVFSSNDGFAIVELYEGSIKYTVNNKEYTLVPGQRLVNSHNEILISTYSSKSQWTEKIEGNNVPLEYIFGLLKLNYKIDYNVANKWLQEKYTVSLPKDNLKQCIDILNQVSGKNFALIDGIIVLK